MHAVAKGSAKASTLGGEVSLGRRSLSALGLRSESAAANQHDAIKAFVQGTIAEAAPVVPISAQLKYNIDAVCEYIVKKVGLSLGMQSTGV